MRNVSYGDYPDLTLVKRALVVKMRHHGDVLLTSPLFSNLKRVLPHAAIDALLYEETLPMLEGHPAISNFLLYDKKWKKLSFFQRLKQEFALLRQIRKNKYDLVINLTEGDRGAIAALVSGARYKVGFDPKGQGFAGKRKIFTHLVKPCLTPRHTVERQLDALRRIGIFPTPEERDLTFIVPQKAQEAVKKLVGEEVYLLIHPTSRWRFKCWPPHQVAGLIRALHARGERIILSSGPDNQELAMLGDILKLAPHIPVLNLGGKLTLKELGALIQGSKALVCVDSVPLHIASALKTPVVALFGPSSEQNWGPWMHPKGKVVSKKLPCQPCHLDGCGGSKMSDCLYTLPIQAVLELI